MRGEAIKGHLELLLLAVIADKPAHGYALIEELRQRSHEAFDLPEGTVYPALHRLERSQLINSRWDTSSGRRRRIYALTRRGRKALAVQREEWRGFSAAVSGVLGDAR
jgi:PadR family transcriptional regulator PadR